MDSLTLGRFRLIALLGKGGMADVFLAATAEKHVDFTKLVVIKKLREEYSQDTDFVKMFLDEARIAARLNHPNVIQTMEVGQTEDDYFLAMEYLDGQPLNRILSGTSFGMPLGMHLSVLADVLSGLSYAHDLKDYDGTPLNMVHRDVTPHNIFVTYTGQVKVMDFGIAKAAGRVADTRVGVIKGKVGYMAPEQVSLKPVDKRADIYAAGVCIYEAATRSRMWEGVGQEDILRRLMRNEHPRSPKLKRPDIADELDRICQKALAHDPDARYPSVPALQEDLEAYITQHEKRPSPRQLGGLVSNRFSYEQEHARKVIQQQLTHILSVRRTIVTIEHEGETKAAPLSSSIPRASDDLKPDSRPRSRETPSARHRGEVSVPIDAKLAAGIRSSSNRRIYALGTIGAAALFMTIAAISSATRQGNNALASPEVTSVPSAASAMTLTLRASPPEARFRVDDGPPLANPYIGHMKRDNKMHHLSVEASGFVGQTEDIQFDQDVSFRFSLARSAEK